MALTKVRGSGLDGATALKGQELVIDADADTTITADTDDQIDFKMGGTDRFAIKASGSTSVDLSAGSSMKFTVGTSGGSDSHQFINNSTEAMRIDSSGNLLVGKTAQNHTDVGHTLYPTGGISIVRDGSQCAVLNRLSSDGTIIDLRKGGTTIGVIKVENGNNLRVAGKETDHAGLEFGTQNIFPVRSDALSDNGVDLGASSNRFDDVFATNGTIQTSDQNEKQDIASVTAKELNVAKKLSSLFKTFRWKDKVIEKGDKARKHTGIIAQEIQSAFSAEGLDASKYGLFTSDTWKNDDGKEQTRLGVRYPELFSFIFSSIEARLTALESK